MKQDEENHKRLRKAVENLLGQPIKLNRDFTLLAGLVFSRCRVNISTTTLKRFWGAIEQEEQHKGIRTTTLDILAQLCGYVSYEAFCNDAEKAGGAAGDVPSSNPCLGQTLSVEQLRSGQEVQLMWKPNRCVTVRYEGMDLFTVLESRNSKIEDGATFHCSTFIEGEALLLTCLMNPGKEPVNYGCAKGEGGLSWKVIK